MPVEETTRDKVLSAERAVARIRLAAVAVVTLAYFVTVGPARWTWPPTLALLGAAWAYAIIVLFLEPYRRAPVTATSVATALTDSIFIMVWVTLTGGAASVFHLLYYIAVPAVALRYGAREAMVATALYAATYLGIAVALGQLTTHTGVLATRLAVLLLIGAVSAGMAREAAVQAQARLEMRQRMDEALTAEKRFRGLVEAAPDAMVIFDGSDRIVLVNTETERLFRLSREELLDSPAEQLLPDMPRPRPGSGVSAREVVMKRGDGTTFPAEIRMSPVQTEAGWWCTATIRDLTERKRGEEERLEGIERLKELERLRELDQFKTQFINTAAHELGTPLTPIKLQVHLLKTSNVEGEARRKSFEILERNVNRLHELVKDVLDVARLQASRLGIHRETIDLNRIVLEAAESFQASARQASVELEVRLAPDMIVEADANRLTQVLFNLVSNALKFTPAGGRILVETGHMEDGMVVRVSDTGAGIRAEDVRRLFQPFTQVHDPMQRTRGGSGLGLYISKGIVELHGGRIWCESGGPGKGSTFGFVIPTKPPTRVPMSPPRKEHEDTVVSRARELI